MDTNYIVSEQFSEPEHLRQDTIQKAVQHWLTTELTVEQANHQN